MRTTLNAAHQATRDAIFGHPVARNLEWMAVRSMLAAVADSVEQESNGNLKVVRNGHTLIVHPSRRKNVTDIQGLMDIRHFLQRSEPAAPPAQTATGGTHLLVVIDHREARIYRTELHGAIPQRITPYDPDDTGRHLHRVDNESNGQRKPERRSYYDAIASSLRGAQKILLFGSSTGAASAMDQLLAALKKHHAELAPCVIGAMVLDERHLTEDQVLAKAREVYAKLAP